MFEFIRTHQRLMQFLLLLFIFPSFAFFGIQGYSKFNETEDAIAKVGDQSITRTEFDAAQRQQIERLQQMFGSQFDAKLFDTPEAKKTILDNLIAQRALTIEAQRMQLTVSDQQLRQTISGLTGLTGADGKFDNERYKSLLAAQGMTPILFETKLRQDLAQQELNAAVQSTAFAPKTIATRLSDLNDQQREVQQLDFKADDFLSQVKLSDDQLKQYYEKNLRQFETPERLKADYLLLNNAAIQSQVAVSDAEIAAYYEQNKKRYGVDEQRRASHILIALKKDASAAERTAAKAKADALLTQVKKDPASFGKLAKQNSEDPGSAERNGDLGFFGKGAMVKPFEDAVFKLKPMEISNLVESDFGYHIIQLTELKPPSIKPLDQVKTEISAELKKVKADKKYAEAAEIFNNIVYEQADSLKPAAEKLKLTIQTVDNLMRTPNSALAADSPLNHPKFLKALFADDVIKNKHNSEVVEVAPNTLIAAHIIDYRAASSRPFAEVKDIVKRQLTRIEAEKLALKAGEARLAALKLKDDASGFSAATTVSRAAGANADVTALNAVMSVDTTKLPAYTSAALAGRGYTIFRIVKVAQGATPDAARRQAEQQQVVSALSQQEMAAYLEVLKQKAKVKILKPVVSESSTSEAGAGKKSPA